MQLLSRQCHWQEKTKTVTHPLSSMLHDLRWTIPINTVTVFMARLHLTHTYHTVERLAAVLAEARARNRYTQYCQSHPVVPALPHCFASAIPEA